MKLSRILSMVLLAAVFVAMNFGAVALAGMPSPGDITIEGPEYWGVVVVDCNQDIATLRVKKIDNCDVVTEAKANLEFSECPTTPDAALYYVFPSEIKLFGDPRTPIITKVKNYHKEPDVDVFSFDVQIKFIKNN